MSISQRERKVSWMSGVNGKWHTVRREKSFSGPGGLLEVEVDKEDGFLLFGYGTKEEGRDDFESEPVEENMEFEEVEEDVEAAEVVELVSVL